MERSLNPDHVIKPRVGSIFEPISIRDRIHPGNGISRAIVAEGTKDASSDSFLQPSDPTDLQSMDSKRLDAKTDGAKKPAPRQGTQINRPDAAQKLSNEPGSAGPSVDRPLKNLIERSPEDARSAQIDQELPVESHSLNATLPLDASNEPKSSAGSKAESEEWTDDLRTLRPNPEASSLKTSVIQEVLAQKKPESFDPHIDRSITRAKDKIVNLAHGQARGSRFSKPSRSLMPISLRANQSSEPAIQVTIGRVEVKANLTERSKEHPPPAAKKLDLEEYLRTKKA